MPKIITKQHFRILVIVDVILTLLAATVSFLTNQFLPPELQAFISSQETIPLTTLDIVFAIVLIPFIVWAIQNMYALYHFRPYARRHLLILSSFYLGINLILGISPIIMTGIDLAVMFGSTLICGVQIALMYYSPLAVYFEEKAEIAT